MAGEKMEFRKLTDEEVASRRNRNIAIAIALFALAVLFMVTTMIRIGANLGAS